jgi:methionyl aminopeptidase
MDKSLSNACKAAYIHKKVGSYIRSSLQPNMSLKTIASLIEDKIMEETKYDKELPLERGIAFPTGLSMNNCAAHYTPNSYEPEILFTDKDIIKIDYGVHFNGTIIDSAFTFSFNDDYNELIQISKDTINYAISLCGPDAHLGDIGKDMEEFIQSKEIVINGKVCPLKTMRDLCGHSIKPYKIHGGKAVPNISIHYNKRMISEEFYAIEPFITTGEGISILKNPNSHYMIKNVSGYKLINNNEKRIYDYIIKNYYTLPFCEKWVQQNNENINCGAVLDILSKNNILQSYPPIYDIDTSVISHFEHTLYIKENGIINLTQNEYY